MYHILAHKFVTNITQSQGLMSHISICRNKNSHGFNFEYQILSSVVGIAIFICTDGSQ